MPVSIARTFESRSPMPLSADLTAWTNGPLPDAKLEQLALLLFSDRYVMADWAKPSYTVERNHYRKLAMQVRIACLKMDAWTIEDAGEKLTDEMTAIVFGERRLGKTVREEARDYCETFIADFWGHFGRRLFFQNDIDANAAEVAAEERR